VTEETSVEELVVEDVAPDQIIDPVATLTNDLQRLQAVLNNMANSPVVSRRLPIS